MRQGDGEEVEQLRWVRKEMTQGRNMGLNLTSMTEVNGFPSTRPTIFLRRHWGGLGEKTGNWRRLGR